MYMLVFFLIVIALYCIFSVCFKVPPFLNTNRNKSKTKFTIKLIDATAVSIAKFIPMSMMKIVTLEKALTSANIDKTPKEYMAGVYLSSSIYFIIAIPLCMIDIIFGMIVLGIAVYMFRSNSKKVFKQSDKRKMLIEKELPRFIAYMSSSLKTNRNVLQLLNTYRQNYESELSRELSITISDMHTGNHEQALQRMESRINSSMLSDLVRGLISSMRGDDMTRYFENLGYKIASVWRQRLREQALKKEPKIDKMSYILFAASLASIFIALGSALGSSSSLLNMV